jgi:hypothetical protein
MAKGENVMGKRLMMLVNSNGTTAIVTHVDPSRWLRVAWPSNEPGLLNERFYERAGLAIGKCGEDDPGDEQPGVLVYIQRPDRIYREQVQSAEHFIRTSTREVTEMRNLHRIEEVRLPDPVGDA